RDILQRLLGQLLQPVEVPEIALVLAEPARLLRDLVQHAPHPVLALVVGGEGEHEGVLAELGEQIRQIARGGVRALENVGALVDAALPLDPELELAGAGLDELPHPARSSSSPDCSIFSASLLSFFCSSPMAAWAFPVSAVSCSSSETSLSGSVSICIATWIFEICLSRPSFLWRISSICFFCCQITNPSAP